MGPHAYVTDECDKANNNREPAEGGRGAKRRRLRAIALFGRLATTALALA